MPIEYSGIISLSILWNRSHWGLSYYELIYTIFIKLFKEWTSGHMHYNIYRYICTYACMYIHTHLHSCIYIPTHMHTLHVSWYSWKCSLNIYAISCLNIYTIITTTFSKFFSFSVCNVKETKNDWNMYLLDYFPFMAVILLYFLSIKCSFSLSPFFSTVEFFSLCPCFQM